MRRLYKHILLSDKAFSFYKNSLEGTNTFSDIALKVISKEKGHYYTLLPEDANLKGLYQFSDSILTPSPTKHGIVGNLPNSHTYTPIPSLESEFADFLYNEMNKNSYQLISDDYNSTYKEGQIRDWFKFYGAYYLEETYYHLSPNKATRQIIEQSLLFSKTFWHSLCILSKASLNCESPSIKLADIEQFCNLAQYVLVGAYDGEGYLVWEKGNPE